MEPAIKKVVILLAAALIAVLGLIVLSAGAGQRDAAVTTVQTEIPAQKETEPVKAETTQEPTAQHTPEDEAKTSDANVTREAQMDQQEADKAQDEVIYEGAIAGLSEEEIAKLALAEEQSAHRTEETGIEMIVD